MPSLFATLVHLAQVLLVVLGPLPLCLRLLRRESDEVESSSRVHFGLALLVTWTTAQVCLGLILGLAGLLRAPVLLICEVILLLLGTAALRSRSRGSALPPAPRTLSVTEATLLLPLAIVGVSAVWELLRQPTTNFDSLAYHLPVMARWVQAGRFEIFTALGQTALYPSNWELLQTLFFLPMGHDLLVSLPNLLAWVHLGLALLAVCGELGVTRTTALTAAALVLTLPAVVGRLDAIQPDLALTAFLFSAAFYGMRWLRAHRARDLGLLLVCVGMLSGMKMSGPVYGALVLGAVVLTHGIRTRGDVTALLAPLRRESRVGILALAPALLLAAAWYARNLVAVGNPAGLLQIRLGGWTLFEGSLTRHELLETTLAAILQPTRADHWRVLLDVARDWLGLPFLVLMLLATVGGAWMLLRRAVRPRDLALLGALLVAVWLYAQTPFSGDNGEHGYELTPWMHVGLRYGFPALAILGVLAARGMDALSPPAPLLAICVVASSVLAVVLTLTPTAWALWIGATLCFLIVLSLHRPDRVAKLPRAVPVAFVVILLGVGILGTWRAGEKREAERVRHYGSVYAFLEERVDPRGRLGYVNTPRLYPLLGRSWRRRLVPALPEAESAPDWVDQLRSLRLSALVVGHADPRGRDRRPVERAQRWVRDPETGLALLHDYESQLHDVAVYGWPP